MRESSSWLKIFKALDIGDKETGKYLVNESSEFKKFQDQFQAKHLNNVFLISNF
jgi:hypothetical protein